MAWLRMQLVTFVIPFEWYLETTLSLQFPASIVEEKEKIMNPQFRFNNLILPFFFSQISLHILDINTTQGYHLFLEIFKVIVLQAFVLSHSPLLFPFFHQV